MDPNQALKTAIENNKIEFGLYEYDGMVLSSTVPAGSLEKIKETAFHDEDIVVATYPKCGTTWMQQIVYMIQNDSKMSEKIPTVALWNYIEIDLPVKGCEYDKWVSTPPPHLIKTHLGSNFYKKTLNEKKTKFIVVLRNPKDMLVSFYHFYKSNMLFAYKGTWDEFFQLAKDKKLAYGDYFDLQLSWWRLRHDPTVLVLKYEDMLKAPEDAIRNVMKHMGKSLSDEAVKKITVETSFKAMKANPETNLEKAQIMDNKISPFMRKGQVGDWKNYFSEEQAKYMDNRSAALFEPEGLYMEDQ